MANTKSCESLYGNVILYPLKRYFFVQLCLIQCNVLKSVGELQDAMLGCFSSFYVGYIRQYSEYQSSQQEILNLWLGSVKITWQCHRRVLLFMSLCIKTASKCAVGYNMANVQLLSAKGFIHHG